MILGHLDVRVEQDERLHVWTQRTPHSIQWNKGREDLVAILSTMPNYLCRKPSIREVVQVLELRSGNRPTHSWTLACSPTTECLWVIEDDLDMVY